MARARNIKPGFFTNDTLAELPPLTRLLFAGLWSIADREGRLEDRPKRIKAAVLPYDDCDVDPMLDQLHKSGFIQRYDAAGMPAIQVVTWARHQNPHVKEALSTIPAPCSNDASTGQEPDDTRPSPEQAGLIPSSLIPDSLIHVLPLMPAGASAKLPPCPYQDIVKLYQELLPELPIVRLMDDKRRRALAKMWGWVLTSKTPEDERRATTSAEAVAWFRRYFETARNNDFLMGRTARSGDHAGWRCDLDYLLTDRGLKQVIEKTEVAA